MKIEWELPMPGQRRHLLLGDHHVAFLGLQYDQCPDNPLGEDNLLGTIWSFSRRHVNFKDPEDLEENPDRVFLSYFEHGNCIWGVRGTLEGTPDFRWDGVQTAGVWYPDESMQEEATRLGLMGQDRSAWMCQHASDACEIYTHWCNGEVYYADFAVYPVRRTADGHLFDRPDDYRYDECNVEESICNLYDEVQIKSFFQEMLEVAIAHLELEAELQAV